MEKQHWAYSAANRIIKEKGKKKLYVCASGISPSGTVHIGNFREIVTTYFISKALKDIGEKSKFIYSWDDFDPFRKVPKNVPDEFSKYIGRSYSDIPDPFKCHKTYAEHFEKELESGIKDLKFKVEFIKQNKMYKSGKYVEGIKQSLDNKYKIINILNKYRKEPLADSWVPLNVYCEKCKKIADVNDYDGNYSVGYECSCGHSGSVNFSKKFIVKLPWRVDWPMRWNYENVDFEPGGKDHSTMGGSYDTGKQIIKEIWNKEAPTYQRYDFVTLKGKGGKISSSAGTTLTVTQLLEVYEPNVMMWLFAGIRPDAEFAISFDLDVIKLYEDFDKCERIYFNKEKAGNEKDEKNQKGIYFMSYIGKIPKKMPLQIPFRHMTTLIQIYEGNINNMAKDLNVKKSDLSKVKIRAKCALNWLEKYAPDDFKFNINDNISKQIKDRLDAKQINALKTLLNKLKSRNYNEQELFDEFYNICSELKLENTKFFEGAYLAIIGKVKGPKLANFILTIGKSRIIKILEQL